MKGALFFAFLTVFAVAAPSAQTVIKVAVGQGIEAYQPLVSAVYREIGLIPEFVVVPGPRALAGVEAGTYGADLGRAEAAALAMKNCTPTKVSIMELHLLAVFKEGLVSTPLTRQDLSKYRLAYVRGGKFVEGFLADLGLVGTQTTDVAGVARLLHGGRAEVGLLNSATPITLAGDNAKGLVTQKESLLSSRSVHVFNNKYAEYAPRWDAVLPGMQKDGRLAKLLAVATSLGPPGGDLVGRHQGGEEGQKE